MTQNDFSSSKKMQGMAWLALAVAVMTYIALSVRHIWCPGLGYDEVMWASVAIGSPDSSWTAWRIGRWPVLLALPYIGALKGYIYAPILALFGTSTLSIRLPMILLGAVGIGLIFASARRAIGPLGAILIALFLAINPEIVQRLRHDLGPVALDFVLRAACLLLLLRYADKERPLDALLFWLLAMIGVWQKLTFIWYINAYVVAFALLRGKSWILSHRATGITRAVLSHAFSYLAVAAWVGWVYVTFQLTELQASLGTGSGTPLLLRIETMGHALGLFFQGIETIKVFHDPLFVPRASDVFLFIFLTFVAAGIIRGFLEMVLRPAKSIPFRGIVVVAALAITIQLMVTLPADKVWHRLSLEPFATWLAVDGLLATTAAISAFIARPIASRMTFNAIVCIATIGSIAYTAQIHWHLHTALCAPAIHLQSYNRAIQTPAIWQLLDYVMASDKRFVFLDWGMRNQALLMTGDPNRVIELELSSYIEGVSGLRDGTVEAENFAKEYFGIDRRTQFVFHGPEYTCIPAIRDAFFHLANTKQMPLRLKKIIEEDGAIAFEIWEIDL